MAVRINKASNFKGKSYAVTSQLDDLVKSLHLDGNLVKFTSSETGNENEQAFDLSSLVQLSSGGNYLSLQNNHLNAGGLTAFIGSPSSGKIVAVDSNGHLDYSNAIVGQVGSSGSTSSTNVPNETAVRNAIEAVVTQLENQSINITPSNGISIENGSGNEKIISTNLRIAKLGTATTGFAASYRLEYLSAKGQNGDPDTYSPVDGITIDIVKDQFLKSGTLVYGTSATLSNGSISGESASKTASAIYPFVKLELYTNTDGNLNNEATATSTIYIPVNELVQDKIAGNGISETDLASNVITVVADQTDVIYITKGSASPVMSVGSNGVKATGIQAAIDLAVNDEHSVMSSAVSAVSSNISSVASGVNTAIDQVESNIKSKLSKAVQVVETLPAAPTNVVVNGSATTLFEMTAPSNCTHVLGVYDQNGIQVFPTVVRAGSTFTLTADYGATTLPSGETWAIVYTAALPALGAASAVIVPAAPSVGSLSYKQS